MATTTPKKTASTADALAAFGLSGPKAAGVPAPEPKKKSKSIFSRVKSAAGTSLGSVAKGIGTVADYGTRPLKAAEVLGTTGILNVARAAGFKGGTAARKDKISPLDILKHGASAAKIAEDHGYKPAGQYKNKAARYGMMAFNAANETITDPFTHASTGVGAAATKTAARTLEAAGKQVVAKEAIGAAKAAAKGTAKGFERELARGAVGTAKAAFKDAKAVTKIASKAESGIGKKAIARKLGEKGYAETADKVLTKGWQAANDAQLAEVGLKAGLKIHGIGVVGGAKTAKVARALRAVSPARAGLGGVNAAKGTEIGSHIATKFEKTAGGVALEKASGAFKRLQVEDAAQLKLNATKAATEQFEKSVTNGFAKKWKGAHKTAGLVDALEGDASAIARIEKSHPGLIADARKEYDRGFGKLKSHAGGDLESIPNYTRRVMTPEHRKFLSESPNGGKIDLMEADGKTVSATQRRLKAGDKIKIGDKTYDLKTGTTRELNEFTQDALGHDMYKTDFASGIKGYGNQIGEAAGDRVLKEKLIRSGLAAKDLQDIPGAELEKMVARLGAQDARDAADTAASKLAATKGKIAGNHALEDQLGIEGRAAQNANQGAMKAANEVAIPDVAGARNRALDAWDEAATSKAGELPTNQLDQNPGFPAIPDGQRGLPQAVREMPKTTDSTLQELKAAVDSGKMTVEEARAAYNETLRGTPRAAGSVPPEVNAARRGFNGAQRDVSAAEGKLAAASNDPITDGLVNGVKQNGGHSVNTVTGAPPVERYSYAADKATEAKIPQAVFDEHGPDLVKQYREQWKDRLSQPGNNLGAWEKDGHVYLDVSTATDNIDEAMAGAAKADQLAIHDAHTGLDVSVADHAQTSGNGVPGGADGGAGSPGPGQVHGPDTSRSGGDASRVQGAPPAVRGDVASGDTANQLNDRLQADLAHRERTGHLESLSHQAQVELENATAAARPALAQKAALLDEAAKFGKEADALYAAGDKVGGDVQSLLSQAREQAADLKVKRSAAYSAKQNYRGIKTEQLLSGMNDGWVRHGFYDGGDLVVESDIKAALVKMDSLKVKQAGPIFEKFDRVMSAWKGYQLMTPGFHIRNYMGGMFNNWLAGTDEAAYGLFERNFARMKSGAHIPDGDIGRFMKEGADGGVFGISGENVQQAVAATGLSEGGSKLNPLSRNFVGHTLNHKAGDAVEDRLRGTLYLDSRIKGMTHDEAFMRVQRFHFNGAFRSPAEQSAMSRMFPFFTFTRNNLPLQWEMMLADPGKYTAYKHVQDALSAGNPDPNGTPDNIGEFSLRSPFDVGGDAAYLQPDLMYRDADAFLTGGRNGGHGLANPANWMAQQSNPLVQTAFERTTGVKLSNGKPFKDQPWINQNTDELKRWVPPLKYLAPAGIELGRSKNTKDPEAAAKGRKDRQLGSISSIGFGVGLKVNNQENANAVEKRAARKGGSKKTTKTASTADALKAFGL